MLDIRSIQWIGWRTWNPIHWQRESRRVRWAGAIANWLHNLALYSSHDFLGFNEEWFWRDFESVRLQFPEFGMDRYREMFEQRASPALAPEAKPRAAPES